MEEQTKKIIKYAFLAIIILVVIIINLKECNESYGTKSVMMVPDITKDAPSDTIIKSVTMFIDNSGSIKGYEVSTSNAGADDIDLNLKSCLNNVFTEYGIEPKWNFLMGTKDTGDRNSRNILPQTDNCYDSDLITLIDTVISYSNDSSVVMFVSDMQLSYGKEKLINSGEEDYNLTHLSELESSLLSRFTTIKNNKLDVLLVQYVSKEFNGKYYFNHKEEQLSTKDTIIQNRPCYILAIGTKEHLKSMLYKNCFDGNKNILASFDYDFNKKTTKKCEVTAGVGTNNTYVSGKEKEKQDADTTIIFVRISKPEGDTTQLIFNFTLNEKLQLPVYLGKKTIPKWDDLCIKSVCCLEENQKYKVTLVSYKDLPEGCHTFTFYLVASNEWLKEANTLDDINEDFEGKTWGLSSIVSAIEKAFSYTKEPKVAEYTFNFKK